MNKREHSIVINQSDQWTHLRSIGNILKILFYMEHIARLTDQINLKILIKNDQHRLF